MMNTRWLALNLALGALLLPPGMAAKATADEAAKLKTDLTPMGAERAANADGSIPAWEGGLTTAPPCYKGKGTRYCDPFPDDKPLFTITAQNIAQYKDRLSAGQQAMLTRFPGSYKLNVYPTRRTAAYPDFVYEATYRNALNADLAGNGEAASGAAIGAPFPIPKSGAEPVINHRVRFRGEGIRRYGVQAAVTSSGAYQLIRLREDIEFVYSKKGATPQSFNNVVFNVLQIVDQPPRLAGNLILGHETLDQLKDPRRAWAYSPGQKRLRRAPNVGYDNPGTAADGLRTNDQNDVFNGALDRYTWKLLGKRELYIPYNAYKVHSDRYQYADIVKKNHVNQELTRYELHRVWVVEGQVKAGTSHIYARRTFYIDEDTWSIVLVDIHDERKQLWRWQEMHFYQMYDKPHPSMAALETCYDLQGNRYIAYNMNNQEEETHDREFDSSYFEPGSVQRHSVK